VCHKILSISFPPILQEIPLNAVELNFTSETLIKQKPTDSILNASKVKVVVSVLN